MCSILFSLFFYDLFWWQNWAQIRVFRIQTFLDAKDFFLWSFWWQNWAQIRVFRIQTLLDTKKNIPTKSLTQSFGFSCLIFHHESIFHQATALFRQARRIRLDNFFHWHWSTWTGLYWRGSLEWCLQDLVFPKLPILPARYIFIFCFLWPFLAIHYISTKRLLFPRVRVEPVNIERLLAQTKAWWHIGRTNDQRTNSMSCSLPFGTAVSGLRRATFDSVSMLWWHVLAVFLFLQKGW